MSRTECKPSNDTDTRAIVVYARFSSEGQRQSSINDQAASCRDFAARRGLPPPGRVFKDEAVSVKDGLAPNFHRLLDEVRAGRVGMIYVDELSRISRVTEDVLHVQRLLRFHQASLWAVHEGIDIIEENSDIHVLFGGHKNEMATRDARHRIKRSMDGNLRRGLSNGDVALGYRSIALTDEEIAELGLARREKDLRPYKRFIIDEVEAKIVHMIFNWFVHDKMTIRSIARRLNKARTPRGGKARTNTWRPGDVRKVLSNRRYIGFRFRNKTQIVTNPDTGGKTQRAQSKEDYIEIHDASLAIVDEAMFDAAQERLAEYRQTYRHRRSNARKRAGSLQAYSPRKLFSGTLICGACGKPLVQKWCNGVPYYLCPDTGNGLCKNVMQANRDLAHEVLLAAIREETAPVLVADRVLELLLSELADAEASSSGDTKSLQTALAKVEKEIENLTNALARRPDSKAILDALDAREASKRQLEIAIRKAERRRAKPKAKPTVEWVRQHLQDHFQELVETNVTRAALVLRAITGPIRVFAERKPWLQVNHPVARFAIDFAGMATTVAADLGAWPEGSPACGFGRELEVEIRRVPLYERYAQEVVRMNDELGMSFRAIARALPEKMTPESVGLAYRFGKTGDLYGHRHKAG